MAQHNFNPFSGQNPFALRGIFKKGGPERTESRDAEKANKHEQRKMLEASDLDSTRQEEIKAIIQETDPKLSEPDMDRIIKAEELLADVEKNSSKYSVRQRGTLEKIRFDGFRKTGRWEKAAYNLLKYKKEAYDKANMDLANMGIDIDPQIRSFLKEDVAEWSVEDALDFRRAMKVAENVKDRADAGQLTPSELDAVRAIFKDTGIDDWNVDQYNALFQTQKEVEQNLAAKEMKAESQQRLEDYADKQRTKEKIETNEMIFFVNKETGERLAPGTKVLPPGTYVFSPEGNRQAFQKVSLQSINEHIGSDSIRIRFKGRSSDFELTRADGGSYNENLKPGHPDYVPILDGTEITIPGVAHPETELTAGTTEGPEPGSADALALSSDEERARAFDSDFDAAEKDFDFTEKADRKRSYLLPKELRGLKGTREFRDAFDKLDNGNFLLQQLGVLVEVNGEIAGASQYESPVQLWEAIRRTTMLSKNRVSFREILTTVLGKRSTENRKEVMDAMGEENYKKFMVATKRLLEGIDELAKNEMEEVEYKHEYGLTADAQNAMALAAEIFDPTGNAGRTQWSLRRGQVGKAVTMENAGELTLKTNKLSHSDERGYLYLIEGNIDYDDAHGWVKDIDMADFEDKVYDLYSKGHAIIDARELEERHGKVKYQGEKYDAEDFKRKSTLDLANLTEADLLFIRKGVEGAFTVEDGEREQVRREMEIATEVPPRFAGQTAEMLENLVGLNIFTNAEIEEYGEKYEATVADVLIMERERLESNGWNAGVGVTTTGDFGAGVSKSFSIVKGDRFHLDTTVSLHGSTMQTGLALGVGPSFGIELGKGWAVKGGVGVDTLQNKGGYLSLQKTFDYKEYGIHSAELGVSAGADRYNNLVIAVYGGYKRSIEGVLARETDKLLDAKHNVISSIVENEFTRAENKAVLEKMDPQVASGVIEGFKEIVEREIMDQSLEELNALQFSGIGLGVGFKMWKGALPIAVPIIYGGFSIKGARKFTYFTPQGREQYFNATTRAMLERDLQSEAAGASMSMETHVNLGLNERGEMAYSQHEMITNYHEVRFEEMVRRFATKGIKLEKTADGKVSLEVLDVYGQVNIEVDPATGIEASVANNKVVLNMSEAEALSIARVDQFYDRPHFGYTHHVTLYVSGKPRTDFNNMVGKERFTYVKDDSREIRTSVAFISNSNDRGNEATAAYLNETEMQNAGVEIHHWASEEEIGAAQGELNRVLGTLRLEEGLDTNEKSALEGIALAVIATKMVNYDELVTSVSVSHEVQELIRKEAQARGISMDSEKMNYAMNAVAIESRAARPVSMEAFVEHVTGWDKSSMQNNLTALGVNPSTASRIARQVTERYAQEIRDNYTPGMQGEPIESEIMVTHIAPGTHGETMMILNDGQRGNMSFAPLNIDELGLAPNDAKVLEQAKLKEVYPFPDESDIQGFMRSPLSLAVLDEAANIFGAETTMQLAKIYENGSVGQENELLWADYVDFMYDLRSEGHADFGGQRVSRPDLKLTLLMDCGNITVLGEAGVKVQPLDTVIQADDSRHLSHNETQKYWGLNGAVAVTNKPDEEEDKPKASKDTTSDQQDVDGEPDDMEGDRGDTSGLPDSRPDDWEESRDDPGASTNSGTRPDVKPGTGTKPGVKPGIGTKPGVKPGTGTKPGGRPGVGARPGGNEETGTGGTGGTDGTEETGESGRPSGEGPESVPE